MNICKFCFSETKNKVFCSVKCNGFYKRGKCRDDYDLPAKNHIRISLGKDFAGRLTRKYLHRHIVETQIRPLKAGEIVHHIDENKFNNSLDNLQILASQSEHKELHCFLDKQKAFEGDKEFKKTLSKDELEIYENAPF